MLRRMITIIESGKETQVHLQDAIAYEVKVGMTSHRRHCAFCIRNHISSLEVKASENFVKCDENIVIDAT